MLGLSPGHQARAGGAIGTPQAMAALGDRGVVVGQALCCLAASGSTAEAAAANGSMELP